jgi:putative oxidoreductase
MRAVILIRILVGWVFISEGIQKFLFPQALGAGRFAQIGIPLPQFAAPAVGFVEIFCGALLILGLFTRWVAIPLLAVIGTAIATTKIPELRAQGVWFMLHDARADFSMALGLLFLLIVGAGTLSIDGARKSYRDYRPGRSAAPGLGGEPRSRGLGSQARPREEPSHTIAGQPKAGGGDQISS